MTAAARIDAALALLGAPFVAGVLFLVTVAVAYVSRVERERRNRDRNPYMAMVVRGRERGQG